MSQTLRWRELQCLVPSQFPGIAGHKYLSLATFRKNGQEVRTPLWFAQEDNKIFLMTRDDSWKYKRMRNNPHVRVAPCSARGRVLGDWSEAIAHVLSRDQEHPGKAALRRKYWLLRIPWLWSKHNVFIALDSADATA